jgi:hypothetical protein
MQIEEQSSKLTGGLRYHMFVFIAFLFDITSFFSFLPLEWRNRIVQILLDPYTDFSLQPSIIDLILCVIFWKEYSYVRFKLYIYSLFDSQQH